MYLRRPTAVVSDFGMLTLRESMPPVFGRALRRNEKTAVGFACAARRCTRKEIQSPLTN
jgi:hypothetical protein